MVTLWKARIPIAFSSRGDIRMVCFRLVYGTVSLLGIDKNSPVPRLAASSPIFK